MDKPSKGQRRQSRELALQVLFQQEFAPSIDHRTGLETFRGNFQATEEVWNYALQILKGIEQNKAEIDSMIESHTSHWTIPRMALVDVNIMRIAIFEIHFSNSDVPPRAAINEAIEIAKQYGTTESASFINGVLDQVLKARPATSS